MWRAAIVLCLFSSVLAASAVAQETPRSMLVGKGMLAELMAVAGSAKSTSFSLPGVSPAGYSVEPLNRQRRARRVLAAGAGLVVAAALAPAYILPNREPCYGYSRPKGAGPLKVAGGVGAVGLVATVGGATWLTIVARNHGYTSSRRERWIAAAIGTLTFVLGQGLLGAVFLGDQLC
jgi:hypothetical protein